MRRLAFILIAFLCGAVSSYFLAPYAIENKDAINALVTTFTVFGGFLIGIITVTGDPALIEKGSWTKAERALAKLETALSRQRALFYLYILVLGLLLLAILVIEPNDKQRISPCLKLWFTRTYMTLAVFSFLLTLALPQMIVAVQRDRFDREVEDRRAKESIQSETGR